MHLLLWMNVMLDSIYTLFAELWGSGRERKMQNDTLSQGDSNPRQARQKKGIEHTNIFNHMRWYYKSFKHI